MKHFFMKVNLICEANETTWSNFNEDWFISDLFFMLTLRHFKQTFWGQVLKGWVCDNLLYVLERKFEKITNQRKLALCYSEGVMFPWKLDTQNLTKGTIHINVSTELGRWDEKMCIFAYYQHIKSAYMMGGWVRKNKNLLT